MLFLLGAFFIAFEFILKSNPNWISEGNPTSFVVLPRNKSRVNSQESRVKSQESRVNSQESTVKSQQSRVKSQESTVKSQQSKIRIHNFFA
jgi:hypothetical protein